MDERAAHTHRPHRPEAHPHARVDGSDAGALSPSEVAAAEQARPAQDSNPAQASAEPHPASTVDGGGPPGDRVAELEVTLAAARAEGAENWEKFLRERAEMENYKRRIERTYADLAQQGRKDLLLKVIGAVDNLERALHYESTSSGGLDAKTLLMGLRMTYAQFKDLLAGEGLKEIETVGQLFDPVRHEAVVTETAPDRREGEIVAELQKGYVYQDELLRPAKVKVATKD